MLVPEAAGRLPLVAPVMRSGVVRPVAQAVVPLLLVPEDHLFMVAQAAAQAAARVAEPVKMVPPGGPLTLTVLAAARRGGPVRVAMVQMALLEPMAVELGAVEVLQPTLVQQAAAELVETLEVAVAVVATVAVLVQLGEPEAMAALVQLKFLLGEV